MDMFTYNLYAAYDVLSIISLGYLHVDFNESDTKISWLNYSHYITLLLSFNYFILWKEAFSFETIYSVYASIFLISRGQFLSFYYSLLGMEFKT